MMIVLNKALLFTFLSALIFSGCSSCGEETSATAVGIGGAGQSGAGGAVLGGKAGIGGMGGAQGGAGTQGGTGAQGGVWWTPKTGQSVTKVTAQRSRDDDGRPSAHSLFRCRARSAMPSTLRLVSIPPPPPVFLPATGLGATSARDEGVDKARESPRACRPPLPAWGSLGSFPPQPH